MARKTFLGQTGVSSEILAGLLLGPSCLGAFFPEQMKALFTPRTAGIFTALAQTGLIFLMFEVGLEFHFSSVIGSSKRSLVSISVMGVVVPFTLGFLTAPGSGSRWRSPAERIRFPAIFR